MSTRSSRLAGDTLADLAATHDVARFHRDLVEPDFPITLEDAHVLRRIMGHLCDALAEPSPEALARVRAALAVLDGDTIGATSAPAPFRAPGGAVHERSPWVVGSSPGVRDAPTPAPRVERAPVEPDVLSVTAPASPTGKGPALPFQRGGSGAGADAPARTLTLALYASYCAARDASADQGVAFLAKHGVADAAAEEAAWRDHLAATPGEEAQFRSLKARFDAWWKGG